VKEKKLSNYFKDVYMTYENAGIKIISDDECCQLLAWLFIYGNNEEFVLNKRLNACITVAQKRLNINSGLVPDMNLISDFHHYVKTIKDNKNHPDWLVELEKKYGIKAHYRGGI